MEGIQLKYGSCTKKVEENYTNCAAQQTDIKTVHLKEALQLQLDVQRRLHEQLEVQRNLQIKIEEQSKQLKMMFNQQQITSTNRIETEHTNNSDANSVEETEILILDDSDDEIVFSSEDKLGGK